MSYQPKPNSGRLFRVKDEDRKKENWPEYEGEFASDCPHCGKPTLGWIKAWVREAKNGGRYFSIAFKHRQKRAGE